MKFHVFTTDLTGEAYRRFLTVMLEGQAEFSLVWRDQLDFSASAWAYRERLAPFEISSSRTPRWPGTLLLEGAGVATVNRYACAVTALDVLTQCPSLFSWHCPAFPEDLAFYDANGEASFASIAHEKEAWVLSPSLLPTVSTFVRLAPEDVDDESARIIRGTP